MRVRHPPVQCKYLSAEPGSASGSELVCNAVEGRGSTCSNRRDGGDANDDNQGEHNRVFNSGWAIFALQKTLQLQCEILHLCLQYFARLQSSDLFLANPEIKRLSCRRRNMFVTGKSDLAIGPTSHSRCRKKLRTRLSNRQIFGDPKIEENFLNQVMLP